MSIQRSCDTSWRMIAIGNRGARSAGPIGCRVAGWRKGPSGSGRSGRMLYQRSGSWSSLRRNFFMALSSFLAERRGREDTPARGALRVPPYRLDLHLAGASGGGDPHRVAGAMAEQRPAHRGDRRDASVGGVGLGGAHEMEHALAELVDHGDGAPELDHLRVGGDVDEHRTAE